MFVIVETVACIIVTVFTTKKTCDFLRFFISHLLVIYTNKKCLNTFFLKIFKALKAKCHKPANDGLKPV